ncbi:MAG: gliding motility-associated C-terminal domain-containing protein [Bacteroidota bacterium]
MKKLFLIMALSVWMSFSGEAQIDSLVFSDSLQLSVGTSTILDLQWVDLDQNKQLDLLTLTKRGMPEEYELVRFIPDSDTILIDSMSLALISDQVLYHNLDHKFGLDIINYKENQLLIYFHEGRNGFRGRSWVFEDLLIETLQVTDLEQDGRQELLVTGSLDGEPYLVLMRQIGDNWMVEPVRRSITKVVLIRPEEVSSPHMLAFGADSLFRFSIDKEQKIRLDTTVAFPGTVGAYSIGYVDDNEIPDIAMVVERNDTTRTFLLMDSQMLIDVDDEMYDRLLVADLNSDGHADVYAENNGFKTVFLHTGDSTMLQFERQDLVALSTQTVAFGDFDFDGDLDLGTFDPRDQLVSFDSNVSGTNLAPSVVPFVLLFQGNESIALYWPASMDDHSKVLTYDLDIRSSDTAAYKSAVFDLDKAGQRDRVGHGNMGSQRFGEFFDLPAGDYDITVQAVDRSFYGGVCNGGGFGICDEVPEELITLCRGESYEFDNGDQNSHWFSANDGYLGLTPQLTYFADADDRLYTVTQNATGCDEYKVWIITVEDLSAIDLLSDFYGCEGDSITIDLSPFVGQIDSLEWTLSQDGEPLVLDSLIDQAVDHKLLTFSFLPEGELQLAVKAYLGACEVTDEANYKISRPEAEVTPESVEIIVGESVQLMATPGFEYQWSPGLWLSANNVADPVATPERSVTYIATITDSLGCVVTDTALINVRQMGFLPELFTPNNDGRNDRLQVYELTSGEDFRFKVFDKRGNVVYQTESIPTLRAGWDGTFNGANIPSGTYFWEVSGTNREGVPILINGGKNGIVNLVR